MPSNKLHFWTETSSWVGSGRVVLHSANADACVNFACKRPNFADVGGAGGGGGGGVKNGKIFGTSFMDGPLLIVCAGIIRSFAC